jgi:hypothetical protein
VHCSRVFRSSVPSSIPPGEHGREDGRPSTPSTMLMAELVRKSWGVGPSGRGQFRASDHDGVLMLAQAALAALGPVRIESGI